MDVTDGPAITTERRPSSALGITLLVLAEVLVLNTALGPLGAGLLTLPVTETMGNQLTGLELVSAVLVAPLATIAGVGALRGHRAAPSLGFAVGGYCAFMFVPYVVGPGRDGYAVAPLVHIALFGLGFAVTALAWRSADPHRMPPLTARRRALGALLLVLAAFVLSRYIPALIGGIKGGGPLPAEYTDAPGFFWSIFMLDLGIVVPGTAAVGIALLRGKASARPALYAIVAWFALVLPAAAGMAVLMVVKHDPHASNGQTIVFVAVAVVYLVIAVTISRPLYGPQRS
jgi:hypothetical protein